MPSSDPDSENRVTASSPGPSDADFPVVAVGASAGGVEAFSEFVRLLPPDLGMGFVLILHLSPDTESILANILARHSLLPVAEAREGARVLPDHVYVIPAGRDMTLVNGVLHLTQRPDRPGRHLPVDLFFRSLAADKGARAVGIVLTGADSDGALGLQAIKSEGGLTFVQDPASAAYPGMPTHALESGSADHVLSIAGIVAELQALARHPYLRRQQPDLPSGGTQDAFFQILDVLKDSTQVDFHRYKESTLRRRIARRLAVLNIERLEDYVAYLHSHTDELELLYRDILIMVTEFFREPETFDLLKSEVFANLLQQRREDDALRIWVIGCSTGEEPYSLAMSLLEFFGRGPRPPVQIFASDVNESDVAVARAGLYSAGIESQISPTRLQRFFEKTTLGYQVKSIVREMCIFAKHDVTRDPPFTRLDLIMCRNVLIYFGQSLQDKLIPMFHYALQPTGFLVLGSAESVGDKLDLFEAVDKKHKIYAKKPARIPLPIEFGAAPWSGISPAKPPPLGRGHRPQPQPGPFDVQREADRLVANTYAPASIVVRGDFEIVQFRGDTNPYLAHHTGSASLDLLQMAREGLVGPLRAAVEEARERRRAVRSETVALRTGSTFHRVILEVIPFNSPTGEDYFIISFQDEQVSPPLELSTEPSGAPPDELSLLRAELETTREHLQSVIQEKENANEELRAAYEEIQSSNEELQSINEELETAKEELQSINEELHTVNKELQQRNQELTEAHDDLANLVASANIPIVMLDRDLRIRRFTPGTSELINIIPADVGRPIGDIRLPVDFPKLETAIRESLDEMTPRESEVLAENGRWYSMRIRPYMTGDRRIQGVVLSFIDIDDITRNLARLSEMAELAEAGNVVRTAVNSTLDFGEVIDQVLREVTQGMSAESAFLAVPEGDVWAVDRVRGLPDAIRGEPLAAQAVLEFGNEGSTRRSEVIRWADVDEKTRPDFIRRLSIASSLAVPLSVRGANTGILFFNHHSESLEFSSVQVEFAEELAEIISLGMENARMRAAEHTLAQALRSRLRPVPVDIPGYVLRFAYQTAAEIEQVGGDFLDVFHLEGGLIGLLVGDATGKGVEATSVVESLRGMIRALARFRPSPAFILGEANKSLVFDAPPGSAATAVLVILDPVTGSMTYANAGHPEVVFCRDQCTLDAIPHAPPLGALPDVAYEEFKRELTPGQDLVLYTDGLTEARGVLALFGESRLLQLLEARRGEDAQLVADELVRAAREFSAGGPSDDMVVVVLRRL